MDNSFKKDTFAIAVGMCLVALFFGSLGYPIWLGALIGFFGGYLTRIIEEPQKIAWAAKTAWRNIVGCKPPENWKIRVEAIIWATIGINGLIAYTIAPLMTWAILGNGSVIKTHLPTLLALSMICSLMPAALIYFTYDNELHKTARLLGKHCNVIAIPFYAAYFTILWTWKAVIKLPFLFAVSLRFTRTFLLLVHSRDAVACGIYGCAFGTGISLFGPANPVLLLVSVVVGALTGATMRRVVLYLLQPQSA